MPGEVVSASRAEKLLGTSGVLAAAVHHEQIPPGLDVLKILRDMPLGDEVAHHGAESAATGGSLGCSDSPGGKRPENQDRTDSRDDEQRSTGENTKDAVDPGAGL
jgi:hypothetical protein